MKWRACCRARADGVTVRSNCLLGGWHIIRPALLLQRHSRIGTESVEATCTWDSPNDDPGHERK